MIDYIKWYFVVLVMAETLFMVLSGRRAGLPKPLLISGAIRHVIMYSPVIYILFTI